MCKCGVFIFSVVIISNLMLVHAFNLDIFNYARYHGQTNSMFGFSVATHKDHGNSWVVVGAPEAQETRSSVHRGGVVYRCSTRSDESCQEIPFQQAREGVEDTNVDNRTYQWFGATVSSGGIDKPVVACAPRYVWHTMEKDLREPVGTCYVAKNFHTFSDYSPCRTSLHGYHRQGSCQAGFSAGISKDGKRLFVGAPGSWYWQGQIYSIDPEIKFPFHPGSLFGETFGYGIEGQAFQQSLDNRPAVLSTPEGVASDDNTYMGYSMVVGDFKNEGVQGIAVGRPKAGMELQGQVLLYTWSLINFRNLTGLQIGGYFGYSLATSDIDGDGRDDIIIGAPMHTEKNTDNKYDVGRVYVAYQGQNALYEKMEFVDGFNSMSRFGLSVCSLGDMNLDDYGDFAVGAPYDGGSGAVYIFQGGPNGFIKKYTQVIYAKNVEHNIATLGNLTTFGFSLSGGIDLDGNDYPDMAVGAYLFDEAFFFRARPVVKVNGYIKFLAYNKQISLDQENCISPHSGMKVACTDIEVCMQYKGVTVPDQIEMNLEFTFDSRKSKYTRMFLGDSTDKVVNKTLILRKDADLICPLKYKVYMDVNKKIIDKLTDLEIEVRYSLKQDESQFYQRNPNSILLPIVDLTTPAVLNDTISIFKNCGDDNICIPDLNITIESKVDKYTYEIGKSLAFTIVITNSLEDSYGTVFYFELPKGIDYKGAMMAGASQEKVTCLPTFNKTVYECEIGNPLPKGSVVRFILEFEPIRNELILSPTYVFVMNVTSANAEDKATMKDNMVTVTVDVWVNAYIAIEKKSYPNEVYYNASQYNAAGAWDTEIGPSVIHLYTITNKGPSDVEELELFVIWPYATSSGEDLLYLIEQPHVHGSVTCEPVDVNPRGYSLALQRNVWEIFDMSVPTTVPTPSPTAGPAGQLPGTESIETVVTFYDQNNKLVKEVIITGEGQKYWQELAKITNEYNTPYTIKTNTTIVTTYINKDGQKVIKKVQRRPTPDMPYTEYATYFDTYTNVSYFGPAGNLIYEEKIMAKPDSDEYRSKVDITKKKYPDIATLIYKQMQVVLFKTLDGKVLYSKEFGLSQVPLKETITSHNITTVTITDNNGVILDQKTITVIPDSKAYWDLITEIIKQYNVPLHITTSTVKVITHYVNGEKTHEETVKISNTSPFSKPIKPVKTVVTLITYLDENRNERYRQTVSEEPDSSTFKAQVENVVQRLRGTIIVQTNTTITTEYQSLDGTSLYRTITKKFREEWYNQKISPPQPPQPPYPVPTPSQPPQPQLPSVAVTTISFYDSDKKLLHSEEIQELPGTNTYWEHIVSFVRRTDIPIKISTTLNKVITHYEGSGVRYERIRLNAGIYEQPITMKIDINNVITYYRPDRSIIHTETIKSDFGEAQRQESYARIHSIYTGTFIVEVNATRTISYISTFNNNVLYSDVIYKSLTQTVHQKIPQIQPQTSFLTIISFYDQQNRFIHKEEIRDSAGSTVYWDSIKRVCQQYVQPLIIHTNSSRIITYFNERGEELNKEYKTDTSGDFQRPITVNIDITTILIYYREDGSEIRRETIKGVFGEKERQERYNAFYLWYNRPFTMDITTTKKISFVSYSGQVINSDMVLVDRPTTQPDKIKSEITRTSFIVYGRDGKNIVYQQTIDVDPSSDAYKTFLGNLINRYNREGATIYTNSTKIITFHNSAGEERVVNVPGTSMRTNPLTSYGQNSAATTTTITVYDPKGVQIHQDVLSGASAVDLQNKIQEITRISKSGDNIYNTGSDVSFIDAPHVTHWQHSSTDFNDFNNEGRGYNQSYQFNQNSQFGNQGEFNFNSQDLGSFAKGQNGFVTGGFEWNPASRNSNDNMRTHGSQVFSTRNVQSWENQANNNPRRNDNYQIRNKREVDTTSKDIEKLSDCKTSKCITIKCVSGPLRNGDEVHIALRGRVNVQTLKNITTTKSIKIQSMLLARISKFQNISGPPGQRDLYRQQAVTTIIAPESDLKADIVPLWVVVVSAVAGTLILLLLIFLLYKCGFFKRNRPSDAPERQPLNRNGHFQHGDEAL